MARRPWVALALVSAGSLLTGCPPLNFEPDALRFAHVYVLGDLEGPLADNIPAKMELTGHDGLASNGAFIMAGSEVARLSDSEQDAVVMAFKKGHPLMLVEPLASEINALVALLGQPGLEVSGSGGDDGAPYSFFGIDLEPNHHVWRVLGHQPIAGPAPLVPERTCTDEAETDCATEWVHGDPPPSDHETLQDARAEYIEEWIRATGSRIDAFAEAKSFDQASKDDSNEITKLAIAVPCQSFWQVAVAGTLQAPTYNNFTITNYPYTCHSFDSGKDYLYVIQYCVLSGANGFHVDIGYIKYWFMSKYAMSTYITGYENNPNVTLITSSPATTSGVTTVASGTQYSITGTIGINKQGPSASVTGGVTFTDSRTISIPDVAVSNTSGSAVNDASWNFDLKGGTCSCKCADTVCDVPVLSYSTFQPVNQWIWMIDSSVRQGHPDNIPLHLDLSARMSVYMTLYCNAFGCDCDLDEDGKDLHYSADYSVPWPPNTLP